MPASTNEVEDQNQDHQDGERHTHGDGNHVVGKLRRKKIEENKKTFSGGRSNIVIVVQTIALPEKDLSYLIGLAALHLAEFVFGYVRLNLREKREIIYQRLKGAHKTHSFEAKEVIPGIRFWTQHTLKLTVEIVTSKSPVRSNSIG